MVQWGQSLTDFQNYEAIFVEGKVGKFHVDHILLHILLHMYMYIYTYIHICIYAYIHISIYPYPTNVSKAMINHPQIDHRRTKSAKNFRRGRKRAHWMNLYIPSGLMGYYSGSMGFYSDLMGFYSDSMGY